MAPESESLIKAPAEGARGQNLVGWRRRKNDKNAKKVRDFVRFKIWSINHAIPARKIWRKMVEKNEGIALV